MKNKYSLLSAFSICLVSLTLVYSCGREELKTPPAAVSFDVTEEFDTITKLYSKGWDFNNKSNPQGAATWQQGVYVSGKFGPDGFPAYSYTASADEYMFAGYQSGLGNATIDSWMITPAYTIKNGDVMSFYTRTFPGSTFPDRLEVRANLADESGDSGGFGQVGKFTTLIASVNPTLTVGGYPENWTKYSYTVTGLAAPVKRRFAFRYFVTDGGTTGVNSNAIGIDLFKIESN